MKYVPLALLWLCLPAAALPPAGSVYRLPDAESIRLSDDGSGLAAVLMAEASAAEPALQAQVKSKPPLAASLAPAIDGSRIGRIAPARRVCGSHTCGDRRGIGLPGARRSRRAARSG